MAAQVQKAPRLLRRPEVQSKVGDSRSALYKHISDGLFPTPVKIGERASAWPENEVDAVIAARIAGKPATEIKALVTALETARKG